MEQLSFTASAIEGSGRGKELGVPTVNVDLSSVPEELEDGNYACFVELSDIPNKKYLGAMHYGPRPVFRDSRACEVHVIDEVLPTLPTTVAITVIERLRDIDDFPSAEALVAQIQEDIAQCRAILSAA